MNHWSATGWLTAPGEERQNAGTQRHFLRWWLHVRDRAGREHVFLCEAQAGDGCQDVPLAVLQKWERLLTPGRQLVVEGEAVKVPKCDARGQVLHGPSAGSIEVKLITAAEFPDRSHPAPEPAPPPEPPAAAAEKATKTPAASSSAVAPEPVPSPRREYEKRAPRGSVLKDLLATDFSQVRTPNNPRT